MKKILAAVILPTALALLLGGCESSIRPLRPLQRVEIWVPDAPAAAMPPAALPGTTSMAAAPDSTQPATSRGMQTSSATQPEAAATESSLASNAAISVPAPATATMPVASASTEPTSASAPATQPGHIVVKFVNPNQTARFIYKASYDNIWKQAATLIYNTGFLLDRQDYRLGVMTTEALPGAQIVEFWKPQQVNARDSLENTINDQRRRVRITISDVPGKPDFYEIGVQVIVERQTNPTEALGGPIFVEGSGFGRNALALRSDYATQKIQPGIWIVLGHDPDMEKKLIDALFLRL